VKNVAEIKSFGTSLRKIREQKGYSQQQLADIADIAKITIQRIENAKFTATLDVLISISKALKIPLKELLDFKTKSQL
jgi:transcriptional regulator with XRE-family HTH domain